MGKTGTVKHTHKYMRRADGMWACSGIDECSHYMPKNMAPLPAGKQSICWMCGSKFQLAPYNMVRDMPYCDECEEKSTMIAKRLAEQESEVREKDPYAVFRTKPKSFTPPRPVPVSKSVTKRIEAQTETEDEHTFNPSSEDDEIEVFEPEE